MKCEECELESATAICTDCDEILCPKCDILIHSGGKRRSHQRFPVCDNCRSKSVYKSQDSSKSFCELCRPSQSMQKTQLHQLSTQLAVFWDITLITSQNFSVSEGINQIALQICKPIVIKLYSDGWTDHQIEENLQIVHRFGMRALDALFLDLSVMINSGITHALIITSNVVEIQSKVKYLKNCKFKVILAEKVGPLQTFQFEDQCNKENFYCVAEKQRIAQDVLREEAGFGKVAIEKNEMIDKIMLKYRIGSEQAAKALENEIKMGEVIQNIFKIKEKVFRVCSLKVENVAWEVVEWVVKSLKFDELASTKKNIVNRLEKVFKLRVNKETWNGIKRKMSSEKRSLSCIGDKSMMVHKNSLFMPMVDRWKGLDSYKTDVFNIKRTDIWDEYLEFCESYFSSHFKQSIPMGRFGLILLLKYSGPDSLKFLSTGKLTYLVNQSISEDYLRYNKTQLIWSRDFGILDGINYNKLQSIKSLILALVSQAPIRICILKPTLLKDHLVKPDLSSLGFRKLKDLIQSIPELKLKNGLIKLKKKKILSYEILTELINSIVKETEYGITESVLKMTLKSRLNHSIDWRDYKVASCIEFIKLYSQHEIEILTTPECHILFKPNDQKTYSYFFPFKHPFGSAMLESGRVTSPNIYHPVNFSVELSGNLKSKGSMHRVINISNIPLDVTKSNYKEEEEDYCVDPFILDISDVSRTSHQFKSTQHSKNSSLISCHIRGMSSLHLQEHDGGWENISWVEI